MLILVINIHYVYVCQNKILKYRLMKKQIKKLNLQKEKISKVKSLQVIVGGTNADETNNIENCCSIKNNTHGTGEVGG